MFALVDCNNFYASCERIFHPELREHPIVVLSNNDGCVIARSNESKALGIKMGEPYFKAEPIIKRHNVKVFSSNFELYGDISNRIMEILHHFAPRVEFYSVDECFLDLTGIRNPTEHCREMRQAVLDWVKIPVSIGIAETKTLTKVAGEIAKKSPKTQGVLNLYKSRWTDEALRRTPIYEVWGVGRALKESLKRRGIDTAYDLKQVNANRIRKLYSVVLARTVKELQGVSCIPLKLMPEPRKGIMTSRSFGRMTSNYNELEEAVATYASRVGEKMRGEGLTTKTLYVFIRTNPFRPDEPQYKGSTVVHLKGWTQYTPDLIQGAITGLKRIYRPEYRYHKAGVMGLELEFANQYQTSLFQTVSTSKTTELMKVVDYLNYHRPQVKFGAEGWQKGWWMKQEKKSPRLTTRWNELVKI